MSEGKKSRDRKALPRFSKEDLKLLNFEFRGGSKKTPLYVVINNNKVNVNKIIMARMGKDPKGHAIKHKNGDAWNCTRGNLAFERKNGMSKAVPEEVLQQIEKSAEVDDHRLKELEYEIDSEASRQLVVPSHESPKEEKQLSKEVEKRGVISSQGLSYGSRDDLVEYHKTFLAALKEQGVKKVVVREYQIDL